jgi:hypothetical protein
MPTLVQISPTGMHLILIPLVLGHLNTTMFLVSFLLSIGDADIKRSARRIVYFNQEHKKIMLVQILHAPQAYARNNA